MPSRRELWSSACNYVVEQYSSGGAAKELAAACLALREADWAATIHPFISHGQLGFSIASDYAVARKHRAIWLARDANDQLTVTFQEELGSEVVRTEHLATLNEPTLRLMVAWLHGEGGQ